MSGSDKRDTIKAGIAAALLVGAGFAIAFLLRVRQNQTTIPGELPYAETLSYDELLKAKAEYLGGLRNRREVEAFHMGRVIEITRRKTWGDDSENLGESGYAESEQLGSREREAFAMGIHFAQEEAKAGERHAPAAAGRRD